MKQRKLLTLGFGLMFTDNTNSVYVPEQEQSLFTANNTTQSIKPDPSFIETFIYSPKDFELSKKHIITNFIGQFLILVLIYSLFFALKSKEVKPVLIPSFVFVFSLGLVYSISCYNTILHSNSYWTALSLLKLVGFMVTNYVINNENSTEWNSYKKAFCFLPFFSEETQGIIFCIIFGLGVFAQMFLLIKQRKLNQIFIVINNFLFLLCFIFSACFCQY